MDRETLALVPLDAPRTPASESSRAPSGTIGILGGMGPAATADFYATLVRATPATRDQQHLHVVIWSDPTVPDRTRALLGQGPDPTPWLIRGAEALRTAGAALIAVPCNTAHVFLPEVAARVDVPIVDMIGQVARRIRRLDPPVHTAGLLATSGTVNAGLYQDALARVGIEVITPTAIGQETLVMASIRAVKAGRRGKGVTQPLATAADELTRRGAQVIIAGCTEIVLATGTRTFTAPVIDPAETLAKDLVAQGFPSRPGNA